MVLCDAVRTAADDDIFVALQRRGGQSAALAGLNRAKRQKVGLKTDLFFAYPPDYLAASSASLAAAYSAQVRLSPRSNSASVSRADTSSEACSASVTTDLKYQQAYALTRQRAGTSGRDAQMRLSSIPAN